MKKVKSLLILKDPYTINPYRFIYAIAHLIVSYQQIIRKTKISLEVLLNILHDYIFKIKSDSISSNIVHSRIRQ